MNPRFLSLLAAAAAVATTPAQADPASVAGSINSFGLDLHRRLAVATSSPRRGRSNPHWR
jgi:hypothetical protein